MAKAWLKIAVAAATMLLLACLTAFMIQEFECRRLRLEEQLEQLHLQQKELEKELERNRGLLEEVWKRRQEERLLLQQLQQWLDTWQVAVFEATAYAPFDAAHSCLCHDGNPGVTAAGTQPGPGTVAVDPREIPYGTPLWVAGYGWGKALDTGAAMRKGQQRLDLFFQARKDALDWGRRSVTVVLPMQENIWEQQ